MAGLTNQPPVQDSNPCAPLAAAASRSDDTTKLKSAILTYIHEDPKRGSKFSDTDNFELLVTSDSKDLRGFRHLDTAVHLCPLRLMDDFENDSL